MKVNTIDIQTTYHTHLLEGNYKDLLCFAPLKKLNSNDWAEYYGKEYDTDNPQLDTTMRHRKSPLIGAFFYSFQ